MGWDVFISHFLAAAQMQTHCFLFDVFVTSCLLFLLKTKVVTKVVFVENCTKINLGFEPRFVLFYCHNSAHIGSVHLFGTLVSQYSVCPPRDLITAAQRSGIDTTAARTVLCGISIHAFIAASRSCITVNLLRTKFLFTSANMFSIIFKSGDCGGSDSSSNCERMVVVATCSEIVQRGCYCGLFITFRTYLGDVCRGVVVQKRQAAAVNCCPHMGCRPPALRQ